MQDNIGKGKPGQDTILKLDYYIKIPLSRDTSIEGTIIKGQFYIQDTNMMRYFFISKGHSYAQYWYQ